MKKDKKNKKNDSLPAAERQRAALCLRDKGEGETHLSRRAQKEIQVCQECPPAPTPPGDPPWPLCPSALVNGRRPPVDFAIQWHHNGCGCAALHISDDPPTCLSARAARTGGPEHASTPSLPRAGGDVRCRTADFTPPPPPAWQRFALSRYER